MVFDAGGAGQEGINLVPAVGAAGAVNIEDGVGSNVNFTLDDREAITAEVNLPAVHYEAREDDHGRVGNRAWVRLFQPNLSVGSARKRIIRENPGAIVGEDYPGEDIIGRCGGRAQTRAGQ